MLEKPMKQAHCIIFPLIHNLWPTIFHKAPSFGILKGPKHEQEEDMIRF